MIRAELHGMAQMRLRVHGIRGRVENPGPGLLRAGLYVRSRAIWRIKSQGGDQTWAPTLRGGHIGIDTGRMWQSVQVTQPDAWSVMIGTNVHSKDGFAYPRAFQFGRGPITATGKALKFTINGVTYYRRSVGPQPPRRFLLITQDDRAKIRQIVIRYVMGKAAA